jgi:hypothetical protein
MLFRIKSGATYDMLGLAFGLGGANTNQDQALGLRILRAALKMPKQAYESIEEFKERWLQEDDIFINAPEQRRQRPSDKEDLKDDCSGTKNADCKNASANRFPKAHQVLSQVFCSSAHGYAMLKRNFLRNRSFCLMRTSCTWILHF